MLRRSRDGDETIRRRRRDRHEHFVRARARDRALGFVEAPDDADPENPPPPHARVVVEEPDDALITPLAELAREAASRSSGADDEHPRASPR